MALSPMMRQVVALKEEYKDALLFVRVGDFYELYFEDAVTASDVLDIHLTGRDCGLEERVPMAGVPYHAAHSYIAKLIDAGYKVAICEQVGGPEEGKGGLFKREVIRVITPGTVMDSDLLDEEKNNYIASVYYTDNAVAVAWADISTGEFNHAFLTAPIAVSLGELLTKIEPSEIICNEEMLVVSVSLSIVKHGMVCPFSFYREDVFETENATELIEGFFEAGKVKELKKNSHSVSAAGGLLAYLNETQKRQLKHIQAPKDFKTDKLMQLDHNARRHLELVENLQDKGKKGSLLWLIDKTATKMGARLLRRVLCQPYLEEKQILTVLDGVDELQNDKLRDKLHSVLKEIGDIERLVGKLSYGNIIPREMLKLGNSLSKIAQIKANLQKTKAPIFGVLNAGLVDYSEIYSEIEKAIKENAPPHLRDGGVFCDGFDKELDDWRNYQTNAQSKIAQLEAAEKAETKIKNLRITYSRNSGYCIEVSRSQSDQIPFRYIRRVTLKNAERYTTEELRVLEEKILGAGEKAILREGVLYQTLIAKLQNHISEFLKLSQLIAELDMITSHAETSRASNFTKPNIAAKQTHLNIIEGRHPVVEKMLKDEKFVANDTLMDENENRLLLITGPNMAGKSVYMKQVAVITILAHIGCFVPAKSAMIPVTERIFTRVGASDDMLTGRSTFMVEMSEISSILNGMSDRTLILFDEVGRGTSTYDGLSIAWAILEHLVAHTKAKVLFSTHYHELTDLEGNLHGLKNYKLSLREAGGSIIFLRKLMRGKANRSFGIEVASLAGLPNEVLNRAKELLAQLEASDIVRKGKMASNQQISIFNQSSYSSEVMAILKDIDLDTITPRNALDILTDLKEKADKQ